MSLRNTGSRYGSESYCAPEAHIPRNVRPRHVLGVVPCAGGHVMPTISPKKGWVPRGSPKLSSRHRGLDACHKPTKKGMKHNFQNLQSAHLGRRMCLPHWRPQCPYLW